MKHEQLESEIINSLDAFSNQLGTETTVGLQKARTKALQSETPSMYPVWLNWKGATGFAGVVLLITVSMFNVNQQPVSSPLLDDLDLLVSEDLEFYQDLEVIQWIVTNDIEFDS
ncbi:MAG: hypothetical protein K0U68_00450 [Gammaproteobacteria bacterium]|nr:hypothetical protein [Gammaproteobacteria bacterium]